MEPHHIFGVLKGYVRASIPVLNKALVSSVPSD